MLFRTHPDAAERFLKQAQRQIKSRFHLYEQLAHLAVVEQAGEAAPPKAEEKPADG
jgi:pyruvate-ferredoxin/flavodoxin oxidoreductase